MTSIATKQALQFDIAVESVDWENRFDSMEIWRSRASVGGPYDVLTGDTWASARLPMGADNPPSPPQTGPSLPLTTKKLNLLIDELKKVTVTFTGPDPVSLASAATQIQSQSVGLVTAYVLGSQLVIQTTTPGTGAVLRVVGGDAAPLFGFATTEPGNLSFGLDARVQLVHGVSKYIFTDQNGSVSFFYKTRFFNSATHESSEYSLPFQGSGILTIDPSNVIRGTVDLVDIAGVSIANQPVLLYNRFEGHLVEGKVIVGGGVNGLTDANGHIEFLLVRGSKISVAIGGTNLVRDVVVPTDPSLSSFNLLDPQFGTDDVFNVQVPNIDYAVRRAL